MFNRRRPGGRGIGSRGGSFPKPVRGIPPMLIQAHRLFSWRQYQAAAELYERLVEGALQREPSRAPQLLMQAGRARLAGGQVTEGLDLLHRGLDLLNQQQRYFELQRMGWRMIQALQNHGLEKQAEELRSWLQEVHPSDELTNWQALPEMPDRKVRLPLSCPNCEGVVNPAEVEWADENTAICSYCGSMLRGESD